MYRTFPIDEVEFAFQRHHATCKVQGIAELGADVRFALRHSRKLDDGQQGLSADGWRDAQEDGRRLHRMGVTLARLDYCPFLRNMQGADARRLGYREASGKDVPMIGNPLASGPINEFNCLLAGVREFGEDDVVHRWLGRVQSLRTMTAEIPGAFVERARLMVKNGLDLARNLGGAIFTDGNFEMCVALHYQYVGEGDFGLLRKLASDKLWQPQHGYLIGFRGNPGDPHFCEFDSRLNPIERS